MSPTVPSLVITASWEFLPRFKLRTVLTRCVTGTSHRVSWPGQASSNCTTLRCYYSPITISAQLRPRDATLALRLVFGVWQLRRRNSYSDGACSQRHRDLLLSTASSSIDPNSFPASEPKTEPPENSQVSLTYPYDSIIHFIPQHSP